jgi:hypothetical protein
MTEISKEWCLNMAKQEEGDISAGKLAIDPATPPAICSKCQQSGWDCGCADDDVLFTFPALADNFQNLPLNESFERVAKVAEEREAFNEQMAANAQKAIIAKCIAIVEATQFGPTPMHTVSNIIKRLKAMTPAPQGE